MENSTNNKMDSCVFLYLGDIPQGKQIGRVYPETRDLEIAGCGDKRLALQKYCVWELFAYAVERELGKNLSEISLYRDDNGVWKSNDLYFSLSHSGSAIAVALANTPVGADVERIDEARFNDRLADRILVGYEKSLYEKLYQAKTLWQSTPMEETPEYQRAKFLAECWTKKESIFKRAPVHSVISQIDTTEHQTYSGVTVVSGERYAYSVACEPALGISIIFRYSH